MTETWVDEDTHVIPKVVDTSGAPPWAGDKSAQEVEEPPPWESGPWPGPGEERPASPHRAVSSARAARGPADETGNWQAMAALFAGIVPLILPGAVLGVLGLRQAAKSGIGRMQSWLGIAFSGIWAVVLIIVLMSTGGGSGAGCSASSQAAVSGAVTTAVRDLSGGAAKSTVITDLNQAISQANSAAAADQQVAARGALVTLTTGLERALATIQGGHSASSYTSIANELTADSAAVTSACGG
jgi:hypothetical protein